MVRNFKNYVERSLTEEEMKALIEAAGILSKAFKRPMYQIQINPNEHCKSDVWGIAFALDLNPKR